MGHSEWKQKPDGVYLDQTQRLLSGTQGFESNYFQAGYIYIKYSGRTEEQRWRQRQRNPDGGRRKQGRKVRGRKIPLTRPSSNYDT